MNYINYKKKEVNTNKILKEIKIILIEKKDSFLQLFREQKWNFSMKIN